MLSCILYILVHEHSPETYRWHFFKKNQTFVFLWQCLEVLEWGEFNAVSLYTITKPLTQISAVTRIVTYGIHVAFIQSDRPPTVAGISTY